MSEWRVIQGDCLEVLKSLEDCSVSAVVTDPPYGLSREPDIAEVMRHWLNGDRYEHGGNGFMGNSWDSFVPGPEYWREVRRVMKPGAHLIAMSGTRTWDLLSIAIRFAGFENRDTINVQGGPPAVSWFHGQGFPKSRAIGAAIDEEAGREREVVGVNRKAIRHKQRDTVWTGDVWGDNGATITAPASSEAEEWEGWHTALKPAWEVGLLFRRPLSEGTVAQNVLRWGTGALNIGATRIGVETKRWTSPRGGICLPDSSARARLETVEHGRWPANVALVHSPGCRPIGERRVKSPHTVVQGGKDGGGFDVGSSNGMRHRVVAGYGDADGTEGVEVWDCEEGCPIAELDRQSGLTKPSVERMGRKGGKVLFDGGWSKDVTGRWPEDPGGGASRFFATFRYCPKPSKAEKEAGLSPPPPRAPGDGCARGDGLGRGISHTRQDWPRGNSHPTVKPLDLMRWLARLITPPGGLLLDCFAGSGTAGVAAVLEGFRFLGIEQDAHYCEIARHRIAYHALTPESGAREGERTWSPPPGKHGQMTLEMSLE